MSPWILSLAAGAFALLFYLYKKSHKFSDWGIPHPRELPFLGVAADMFLRRPSMTDFMKELYSLNKDAKYVGLHMFMIPLVVLRDPDLVKRVLVKDFDYFVNRAEAAQNDAIDPLFAKNLASLKGDEWREVRNLLSPAFTSSKMRAMFVLMSSCAATFADKFVELFRSAEAVDTREAFSKYTNDVIATCAFGIEINSLEDPSNEFYLYGRQIVDPPSGFRRYRDATKMLLITYFPRIAKALGLTILTGNATDFFVRTVDSVIKTRDERGITRPDMMQLLMNARGNHELDLVDMAAQAMIFFLAGFDVVTNHLCLMAQELAAHPEVQARLRAEIDRAAEAGEVSYQAIADLPYLDAVFLETQRKHSTAPFLVRSCTKPYQLPATLPGSKPYLLPTDALVIVPVSGIHNDPDLHFQPDRFDPDRFLGKRATSDVGLLGFGAGPRMCLGNRFAVLETKVLFFHLLRRCSLRACAKTCHPFKCSNKFLAPVPEKGFWLKITPRDEK